MNKQLQLLTLKAMNFVFETIIMNINHYASKGSNTSKGIIEVNRYMDEDLLLRTDDP